MPTLTYVCRVCGQPFPWSERSQELQRALQWPPPKRCPECRKLPRTIGAIRCLSCGFLFALPAGALPATHCVPCRAEIPTLQVRRVEYVPDVEEITKPKGN